MMRRTLVAALALTSSTCLRPRAPAVARDVAGASSAVSPGPSAAASDGGGLPGSAVPAESPHPPLAVESVVALATGLPLDAVLTWPTDYGANSNTPVVVLFSEEKAALRRAIAAALTKQGIALVPMAKLELLEDAAAAGKLVLEGDQRCVSPLSRDEVLARYFGGHAKVKIEATCFGDCRLTVVIEKPEADAQYFASRSVKHPEDPKRWIAAASLLSDEVYGFGGLGLSGTSHSPPIRFGTPSWVGRWSVPPTEAQFSTLEPRASACAHTDPMVSLLHTIRVQVGRNGGVDRCAVETQGVAKPADQTCLCDVLSDLRLGAGSGQRRLRVDAIDEGFAPPAGALTLLQPGTEVWLDRLRAALAPEHCAVVHPPGASVDAVVSLRLAPDGRVEDVRMDGNLVDRSAMEWAQCVVAELGAVALPCRPPGIEVLRARLVLGGS